MKAEEEPNKFRLPGPEELAPLKSFDPAIFLSDDKPIQDVCNFVLSLAVAYNDLKDLLWVLHFLRRARPDKNELITRYRGEYSGFVNHAAKLLLSTFNELVQLLEENQPLFAHDLFQKCVKQLPKEARVCWNGLVAVATGKEVEHKFMRRVFHTVRNKVSFHYADLKAINSGFRLRFTDQIRSVKDKTPYASLGKSAMESRFYFADALVESYVNHQIGEDSVIEFAGKMSDLTEQINFALRFLVDRFVSARNGAFREESEKYS